MIEKFLISSDGIFTAMIVGGGCRMRTGLYPDMVKRIGLQCPVLCRARLQ